MMAVIDEDEIEPTTKTTDITINNKKLLHEIMFFNFKISYLNYIKTYTATSIPVGSESPRVDMVK
jgi:hypothetical protein